MELIAALIGAIIGGALTILGTRHIERGNRKRRIEAALKAALTIEIAALVNASRLNRYEVTLRQIARAATADPEQVFTFTLPASQSYFAIFEANAASIGDLDPKAAVDVISFYQQAKTWLDGVTSLNVPPATPEHIILLANMIGNVTDFGDKLAARLAPQSLIGHILTTSRKLDPFNPSHTTDEEPERSLTRHIEGRDVN